MKLKTRLGQPWFSLESYNIGMGIEGGGFVEAGLSRTTKRIEGEPISLLAEISIDEAEFVPLPTKIRWREGELTFKEVARYGIRSRFSGQVQVPLYEGKLSFKGRDGKTKEVNLSGKTTGKPSLFTGTNNGFFAHDPGMESVNKHFYVVGIGPDELEGDIRGMAGVYHELGHTFLYDNGADAMLVKGSLARRKVLLPNYAGILGYAQLLAEAMPEQWRGAIRPEDVNRGVLGEMRRRDASVDANIRLFHERFAWAAGIFMQRKDHSPTGFEKRSSVIEYAKLCLQTYVDHYGTRKFVVGVKSY